MSLLSARTSYFLMAAWTAITAVAIVAMAVAFSPFALVALIVPLVGALLIRDWSRSESQAGFAWSVFPGALGTGYALTLLATAAAVA